MKVSVLAREPGPRFEVSYRVPSLPVVPCLYWANVLVATDEGRLRLSATNLELGITCWLGAKIEEEGSTTAFQPVPLLDLISTLPNDRVEMSLNVRTQTPSTSCVDHFEHGYQMHRCSRVPTYACPGSIQCAFRSTSQT
jgi:hypothetical protein